MAYTTITAATIGLADGDTSPQLLDGTLRITPRFPSAATTNGFIATGPVVVTVIGGAMPETLIPAQEDATALVEFHLYDREAGPVRLPTTEIPLEPSATISLRDYLPAGVNPLSGYGIAKGEPGDSITSVSGQNGDILIEWEGGKSTLVPMPDAIEGPEGPQGPRGAPGPNTVPTDEAIAAAVESHPATVAALQDGYLARQVTRTADDGHNLVHVIDESPASNRDTVRLEDSPGHGGSIMYMHHRSDGSASAQTYGINLANHPNAKSAIVLHQYSKSGPAIQLDNTDVAPSIYIRNTPNTKQNPSGVQTGDFFQLKPGSEESNRLILKDSLTWINQTANGVTFDAENAGAPHALGVNTSQDIVGLSVTKTGYGAGNAVDMTNYGTGIGMFVSQRGENHAIYVDANYEAVWGKPALKVLGYTHGAEYVTSADGGSSLLLQKQGKGVGDGLRVINHGTGLSVRVQTASENKFTVAANGETEILTPGAGLVLRSPNGTRHRITVSNAGQLSATAL